MLVTSARAPHFPIVWANAEFLALAGYSLDELRGHPIAMLHGSGTDAVEAARIHGAMVAGQGFEAGLSFTRKDGASFWTALTATPLPDEHGQTAFFFLQTVGTRGVVRDLADRTRELTEALERKTALLQEIDHRVKNNLQVISSLMLLKARRVSDGEARETLEGMAERIGALSIAHRLLFIDEDTTHFALTEFVAELLFEIDAGMADDRIRIETEIEPIRLPASMAAPLALMLHELLSNALRHAFPGGQTGLVWLSAKRLGIGMEIEIRDDGVGIDPAETNEAGFGRNLVEMVGRQLRGSVTWTDTGAGTRVDIAIPIPAA